MTGKVETYGHLLKALFSLVEHDEPMKKQYERLKDKKNFVPLDQPWLPCEARLGRSSR